MRLQTQKTIDRETEAQRWEDITERLLAIVQFLTSHNLAFKGNKKQ